MDVNSETVSKAARDRRLPSAIRRKAQTEEKERELRNRQKRESD
jgi:hypothetical protein